MCTLTHAGSNIIKEDVKNDERQKGQKLYENQATLAFLSFHVGAWFSKSVRFKAFREKFWKIMQGGVQIVHAT